MSAYRFRWLGALVLSCLLTASCAGAQEKKETPEAKEKKEEANPLVTKARKMLQGSLAEQKEIVGIVQQHLQDRKGKITKEDVSIAFGVASALEQLERRELAAEAYTSFAKEVAGAEDKQLAGLAKIMQGSGRRLGALGKEIEIKGKTLEGKEIELAKLKGKVVLIDFWATWCGPCRAEIPNIKKMYDKYHARGFDVIGVSLDDDKEKLQEFLKEEKLPWPSIYDQATPEGERMAEQYGVMAIPQAILVDQQGHVVALEARGPELGRLLRKLLDQSSDDK